MISAAVFGRPGGRSTPTSITAIQVVLGVLTVYFVYVFIWVLQLPNDSGIDDDTAATAAFARQPWDAGGSGRDLRRRSLLRVYSAPRSSDDAYNVNETLSQGVPLDRPSPDLRPVECRRDFGSQREPGSAAESGDSPQYNVSVIIAFHNEAVSLILRTVHSILNYTPARLLADIVLVDDGSSNANLLEPLDDYVRLLPSKVRLLRMTERAGVAKARMAGYKLAGGTAVAFMDAHVELSDGWLEPLLDYVQRHPRTIVQPVIHAIDPSTLAWPNPSAVDHGKLYRGVMRWDMRFAWQLVPKPYHLWRSSVTEPYPTPVLVGCVTVADRRYFDSIGGFDEGLNIWGGDNVELSLRSWLCGGGAATHPCSRVGHIFKPFSFSFGGDKEKVIAKNNIRVVETWLPSRRDYYYASSFVYSYKRAEYTDEERASLRERRDSLLHGGGGGGGAQQLRCSNFSWYLANVLPELRAPEKDSLYYGEVQNVHSKYCFTAHDDSYVGLTSDCSPMSVVRPEGEFSIAVSGHMTLVGASGLCVRVTDTLLLALTSCLSLQQPEARIELEKNPAAGESTGLITYRRNRGGRRYCLQQVTNVVDPHRSQQMPQFTPDCDESSPWQQWTMTYHFGWQHVPPAEAFS